jgi:valyl-tRNA synthetase
LEIVKLRLDFSETADKAATKAALTTLVQVFECALRLLSPFMPFITEEIWNAVYDGNPPAKSIALTHFPQGNGSLLDTNVQSDMGLLQEVVTGIRMRRKESGVEEKAITDIEIDPVGDGKKVVAENQIIIERLARVGKVQLVNRKFSPGLLMYSSPNFDLGIKYERTIDVAADRDRLKKDVSKSEKIIESSDRQLNNPGFLAKAPAHIVEGLKKQRDEAKRLLDKAQGDLDGLPEG